MKKEWLKRRPVRVGLTAGILTVVVLAALWLCGVFSPAPELPPPSQALIEAWDGLDAVYVEASLDTDASAMTVSQTLTLQNRTGRAQEAARPPQPRKRCMKAAIRTAFPPERW